MSTERTQQQACTPLAERRVVHRVPPGVAVAGPAVDALARCFGPELMQALERRRAERAEAAHGGSR